MCGIIGAFSKNGININHFKNLLNQSMIRGKHATGIAWIEHNTIQCDKIVDSADKYEIKNIETNMIIGHTRYSTSDIAYNQPIHSENIAIVHNGVITQTNPNQWENKYGYKFQTKNDSEIVLKYWKDNKHPIVQCPQSSMAVAILDSIKKTMHFFRNEYRPLWYSIDNEDIYIASTKNILVRSNIPGEYKRTEPCLSYDIINNKLEINKKRDYQLDQQC